MQAIWFAVMILKKLKKPMAMQKRLTKKDRFFNNINPTINDDVYIGIDVHKINSNIAIWLNDAIALTFVTPSDNIAITKMLNKLTPKGLDPSTFGPTVESELLSDRGSALISEAFGSIWSKKGSGISWPLLIIPRPMARSKVIIAA